MAKKNIMRSFKMSEISAVTSPAQPHALALIMKVAPGDPKPRPIGKMNRLTSSIDGHSHLIDDTEQGGETSYNKAKADDSYGHSHPWVKNTDGSITVGEADGHTHDVLALKAELKEPTMKTDLEKAQEENATLKAELAKAQKTAARASALAGLTTPERDFYTKLSGENEQQAFLDLDNAARAAKVAEATAADPVVYTTKAGVAIRKSDGPVVMQLAKDNDELRRDLTSLAVEKADNRYTEMAKSDEFKHIPGTVESKTAMLKAIHSITDEKARDESLNALRAQNTALGKAMDRVGHAIPQEPDANSPDVQIDKAARELAAKEGIDYNKAYMKVLDTPQGRELYAQGHPSKAPAQLN